MSEELKGLLNNAWAEEEKAGALRSSVSFGVTQDPDTYARAARLAGQSGARPQAVLESGTAFEQAGRLNAFDFDKFIQNTPRLATWASVPDNAAVAHDDLATLQTLEQSIPTMTAAPAATFKGRVNDFWRSAMEGTLFSTPEEAQGIRQAESARVRAAQQMGQDPATFSTGNSATLPPTRFAAGVARGVLRPLSGFIRYSERKTGLDTGLGDATRAMVEALSPSSPTIADTGVESFASTLGLLLPGLGAAKVVGLSSKIPALAKLPWIVKNVGPWASAITMAVPEAAAEAEDAYDTNLAKGKSKAEANSLADRVFWSNAALLAATNKIAWFSRGGIGRASLSEAVQEGGQQIIGNTATGRPTFEGVPEAAAMGAGVATAIPVLGGMLGGIVKTRRMGATPPSQDYSQAFLQALADGAENSKLLQRMPEKYQEAVAGMVKDGPVETLRMPPEQFTTYFQSKGLDPAQVAQQLGVSNFMEASLSGGDLLIPTAAYAAQIAGGEHHAELTQDLRLFEGQLTAREEAAAAAGAEDVAGLARQVDEETQAKPEFQTIKAELQARFLAVGESPAVAETYAMDGAKVFATLAAQSGISSAELFAQYAPQIQRGQAPSVQEMIGEAFTEETFPQEGLSWQEDDTIFYQAARDAQPEAIGKAEPKGPKTFYQSKDISFGSKGWQEYYGLTRGAGRAAGDQATRARKSLTRAASSEGILEQDAAREAQLRAEEQAFLDFDRVAERLSRPRGWFTRGADGTFVIGKTPEGDFSTFIHEPAHAYLEMFADLVQREGASDRLKGDWAKTLEFLGAESYEAITTAQHEKWARANEAYAREGRAPSEDLRGVFQRFKVWLQAVYRQVAELDVILNDDIRGVFDRMRASDEEIELAHAELAGPQLFRTAEEAGWTEAQFQAYARERDLTIPQAKETILSKLNEAAIREQGSEWKREEAEVRAAVEAMVDDRQEFRAIRLLRKGALEDGTPLTLNRAALVAQFGEERVKGLQKQHPNLYRAEGVMDAQAAAEFLGFGSGDALLEALERTDKRRPTVEAETRRVMTERHGDIRFDGTIEDQARIAVSNDARSRSLHRELAALRRQADKASDEKAAGKAGAKTALEIPPVQTFREAARVMIEARPIMDLDANGYLNGQRKYSREAYKNMGQGKFEDAAQAKQKELLNHFLYLEAVKGKAEAEKIAAYGKRLGQAPAQMRIGKAQGGFLEQVNGLLERFQFVKETNRSINERQSLAVFAMAQAANGEEVSIDPWLFQETPKNYREMTILELRAVRDALKNIETLARRENEFLADGRKETYEEIRDIFTSWTPEAERGVIHREGDKLTLIEQGGHLVRGLDAELLKVEWMVDRFDRGDTNGPMRTFIKKTIDNASGRKLELGFDIFSRIKALSDARDAAEVAKEMDLAGIKFPNQVQEMTHRQIMSWALNLGTIENRNVALLGEGLVEGEGTLSPLVDRAMSKLTSSQWNFIQGVWDIMEVLRPMIAEKQRRTTGLEPKWKENTPFSVTTADGQTIQLRGGYYPLAADSQTTDIGKNQSDPLAVNGQGSRSRPTVASGFTKDVTGATYQLKLDYPAVLSSHLNDVITNITCGEAVASVNRVISDPDIRRAMEEKLGHEYVATLKPWLVDFVERAQDAPRADALAERITRFKSGATVAILAGSVPSVLVQISDVAKPLFAPGISNLELVKARYDMTLHGKELVEEIKRLSPNVMRHRAQTYNRETKDTLQAWGMFDQKKRATSNFLMSALSVMDAQITFPTWLAVYRKGLKTHNNEAQAITEADAVINRTFQAGDAANMSAMFRSRNAWMRLFTTFQNDGNTWYGLISSSIASKKVGRVSMALMGAYIGQAIGQVVKARGWGDDEEDKKEWLIKQALMVPIGSLPFFGDVLSNATSLNGQGGGDFTSSMMGRSLKSFAAPFINWDDMDWQDVAISEADALGTWVGIPGTAQVLRGWKYVHKVQKGEENPESVGEFVKGVIFGPPPKKKGGR